MSKWFAVRVATSIEQVPLDLLASPLLGLLGSLSSLNCPIIRIHLEGLIIISTLLLVSMFRLGNSIFCMSLVYFSHLPPPHTHARLAASSFSFNCWPYRPIQWLFQLGLTNWLISGGAVGQWKPKQIPTGVRSLVALGQSPQQCLGNGGAPVLTCPPLLPFIFIHFVAC